MLSCHDSYFFNHHGYNIDLKRHMNARKMSLIFVSMLEKQVTFQDDAHSKFSRVMCILFLWTYNLLNWGISKFYSILFGKYSHLQYLANVDMLNYTTLDLLYLCFLLNYRSYGVSSTFTSIIPNIAKINGKKYYIQNYSQVDKAELQTRVLSLYPTTT